MHCRLFNKAYSAAGGPSLQTVSCKRDMHCSWYPCRVSGAPSSTLTYLVLHGSCASTSCERGSCGLHGLQEDRCKGETPLGSPQHHSPALRGHPILTAGCGGGTGDSALHSTPAELEREGKTARGQHEQLRSQFRVEHNAGVQGCLLMQASCTGYAC